VVVSYKDQGYDIMQTGSCLVVFGLQKHVCSSHLTYCMVFLAIRHYGTDMIPISIALKHV